jgi:altered-inheritance-of-mitochondria protein 13
MHIDIQFVYTLQTSAGSPEDIEREVRQRVQAELAKIQAEKDAAVDSTFVNYKSSTNANAVVTEQEMEHLARKTPAKQVKVLPEEITKAQDALVQCYRKNQDRSLDCWAEVQEFKELVQKAQNVCCCRFFLGLTDALLTRLCGL